MESLPFPVDLARLVATCPMMILHETSAARLGATPRRTAIIAIQSASVRIEALGMAGPSGIPWVLMQRCDIVNMRRDQDRTPSQGHCHYHGYGTGNWPQSGSSCTGGATLDKQDFVIVVDDFLSVHDRMTQDAENCAAKESKELPNNENLQSQSPSLIRKETITISKSIIPEEVEEVESRYEESDKSEKKAPSLCRKDTIVIHKNIKKDEPSVSNFEGESNNLAITKTLPPKPPKIQTEVIQKKNLVNGTSSEGKSQQSRPPFQGLKNKTLAKKTAEVPSKEDVIYLVETEAIFDSQEHRKAILDLVSNYAKNARKNQILEMLDHEIFENMDNLEELITVLNDFVAAKSNNNC